MGVYYERKLFLSNPSEHMFMILNKHSTQPQSQYHLEWIRIGSLHCSHVGLYVATIFFLCLTWKVNIVKAWNAYSL